LAAGYLRRIPRKTKHKRAFPFLLPTARPTVVPLSQGRPAGKALIMPLPPRKLVGPDVTTKYGQSNTAKTAQHNKFRWALINRSLLEAIYSGFEPEWTVAMPCITYICTVPLESAPFLINKSKVHENPVLECLTFWYPNFFNFFSTPCM
jgi:hypothetical protein